MHRLLGLALCIAQSGCSLILDFSDNQIPIDAPQDIFTVAECSFDEPNDSFAAATPRTSGETVSAALCADGFQDVDFYKITVPAATNTLTVALTFNTLEGDLDLHLYDSTGAEKSFAAGNLDNEQIVCPGVTPACDIGMPIAEGDYAVEVRSVANVQNTYSLAITLGM